MRKNSPSADIFNDPCSKRDCWIRAVPIRKYYGTFIGRNLSEERFSPNKYSVLLLYEYSPIQQSLLERLALVLSVCYFIILCFSLNSVFVGLTLLFDFFQLIQLRVNKGVDILGK